MKSRFLVSAMLLVMGSSLVSCDKDDDKPVTNAETTTVSNLLKEGNWTITSFKKDGVDQASVAQGYTFSFAAGNELRAVKAAETSTGTWSVTADDDNAAELDLNIFFSNPGALRILNDDWEIINYSENRIEVADDLGERDEDLLVFEKQTGI